jgi:glycosyltransferase involved in cell wall biosynthesis
MKPLVSVIIPTYNGERYLEGALESIFTQTYKNYEVIVVDDGSVTDSVARICDKYKGGIKYIRQQNKGLAAARNTGIKSSCGEYISFLDDDDVWYPEKLEKQVTFYEDLKKKGIDAGIVYTGCHVLLENDNAKCSVLYRSAGNNYRALLFLNFIGPPSSVIVSKSVLEEVGLFDENMKSMGAEDYDLWLRIAREKPVYSINEFLVLYRSRKNSLYKNAPLMTAGLSYVCVKTISSELESGLLDNKVMQKLKKHYTLIIAELWKNAAYAHLFDNDDGKTFRAYIKNGYRTDRSLFGFKVLVYFILSCISPSLCKAIRNLKKHNIADSFKDIICDVKDLSI